MRVLHNGAKLYQAYKSSDRFSDHEAWELFRLAAIGEAVGWTLLIIGILCQKLPGWWGQYLIQLFGSTHGMLFFAYIFAVLTVSPSLKWRAPQILIAGLCSIPPYGSLVYELWAARQRDNHYLRWLHSSIRFQSILEPIG